MGIIGSAFVGLTRVYGAGRDRKIIDIPENGLVAWYDASDYVAGTTTWEDRSNNYLDLTLDSGASKSTYLSNDYVELTNNTAVTPTTTLFNGNNTHTVIAIQNTLASKGYALDGQIYHRATWAIQEVGGALVTDYTMNTITDGGNPYGVIQYWAVPHIFCSNGGGKAYRTDSTIQQPTAAGGGCPTYNRPFPASYSQVLGSLQSPNQYNTMVSYRFSSGLSSPEIGYVDSGEGAFYQYPGDTGAQCPQTFYDTMNGKTSINDNIAGSYSGTGTGTWSFGDTARIRLSGFESGGTVQYKPDTAKYSAMIFYNREITDSELSEIVDHYRPSFDFRT